MMLFKERFFYLANYGSYKRAPDQHLLQKKASALNTSLYFIIGASMSTMSHVQNSLKLIYYLKFNA